MLALKLKTARTAVTKLSNRLDTAMADERPQINEIEIIVEQLNLQYDNLSSLQDELSNELEQKLNDDPENENLQNLIANELDKSQSYTDKVFYCRALVKNFKSTVVINSEPVKTCSIKLPKISLPVFSGDILKWPEFIDRYNAAVDASNLSNVEKFSYLRGQLTGSAITLIAGLPLTANNYDVALNLLKERFGNEQITIRAHVRELLNIECVLNSSNEQFRAMVDKVNVHIRCLKALNVASDRYSIFLTEILLSRIPRNVKMLFAKLENSEQTLESLLSILETEIRTQEVLRSTQTQVTKTTTVRKDETSNNRNFSTSTNKICTICGLTNHGAYKCKMLLNIESPKDRFNFIKEKGLCYNCFGRHRVSFCKSNSTCQTCGKSHNSLLHFTSSQSNNTDANCNVCSLEKGSIMPVISFDFFADKNSVFKLNVLLDSGSDSSFILRNCLHKMKHRIVDRQKLKISGFSGTCSEKLYDVARCDAKINETVTQFDFFVIDRLNIRPNSSQLVKSLANKIYDIDVKVSCGPVEAIIGNDQFYDVVTGRSKKVGSGCVALETVNGWILHGSFGRFETCKKPSLNSFEISTQTNCFFGEGLLLPTIDSDDLLFFNDFVRSLVVKGDGRYVAHFPWKENVFFLDTYEMQARARLRNVVHDLSRKGQLEQYDKILKSYLDDDVAEEVEAFSGGRVRYLPHHGVTKIDSSTTKLRVVLDASAKTNTTDRSLNECLQSCVNLLPNILSILLRFRECKYAVCADVKQAFLQIEIAENDRDSLRYLWYKDALSNCVPKQSPTVYRMKRLPFGLSASPFILCATIQAHLQSNKSRFPKTVEKIHNRIYMDDLILSGDSVDDILKLKRESVQLFGEMKMELRKWQSNLVEVDDSSNQESTVLGLQWNKSTDVISPKLKQSFSEVNTKRELTKVICGFWDPLGLFCPLIVQLKVLLQICWERNLDWDVNLPSDLQGQISEITEDLKDVETIKIPRCVDVMCCKKVLCAFSDASMQAYGACVYLYALSETGTVLDGNLLIAKTRVRPKKNLTIPRLELCAAVVASQLCSFVIRELDNKLECYGFSDSQISLCWIKNSRPWAKFVCNRVQKIVTVISAERWNHVGSKDNPADKLTRGLHLSELKGDEMWFKGTKTIKCVSDFDVLEAITDTKEDLITEKHSFVVSSTPVIDCTRFSKLSRCIRSFAYALRFIDKCRKGLSETSEITVEEFDRAKTLLIKQTQTEYFPNEINCLNNNQELRKTSSLYHLNPFLDNVGLVRVSCRLDNSELTADLKTPILVPSSSRFAKLLISAEHEKLLHAGIATTMLELRKHYWIPKCRRTVKSELGRCNLCKRKKCSVLKQRWAPVPYERTSFQNFRAFGSCGVDYAGPINLSSGKGYIVLFTCLRVRAVHLDVVSSLESGEFLRAFDRFVSRRGVPFTLISDNATTFKGACTKLCSTYGVNWKFITERAPHKGGIWERLIRCIKGPLRLCLRQSRLNHSELYTLACKVESVINKRPLGYMPDCIDEVPLCPENFLITTVNCTSQQNTLFFLKERQNKILNQFFQRWKNEYLSLGFPSGERSNHTPIKPGDVVLLNDGPRREYWPLARIEK